MANKFTRNITNVKNILKQSLNTNNQNDLLSDDKHAYIRNKKEYHCLTDNVKSVNGVKADEKNEVVIPIGIEELNGSNRPSQKITILDSEGNDIVPSEKEYNLGMEHIYQLPKNNNESFDFSLLEKPIKDYQYIFETNPFIEIQVSPDKKNFIIEKVKILSLEERENEFGITNIVNKQNISIQVILTGEVYDFRTLNYELPYRAKNLYTLDNENNPDDIMIPTSCTLNDTSSNECLIIIGNECFRLTQVIDDKE